MELVIAAQADPPTVAVEETHSTEVGTINDEDDEGSLDDDACNKLLDEASCSSDVNAYVTVAPPLTVPMQELKSLVRDLAHLTASEEDFGNLKVFLERARSLIVELPRAVSNS